MGSGALTMPSKKTPSMAKPKWHAPWKLYRVISGHLGWVRCCAVEPENEWFATGSADRVIKVSAQFSRFYLCFNLFNNVSEHIRSSFSTTSLYDCFEIADMGSSEWQVEGFANRSHKQRSWSCIFTKASLPIFLWRGSTSQVLGSRI